MAYVAILLLLFAPLTFESALFCICRCKGGTALIRLRHALDGMQRGRHFRKKVPRPAAGLPPEHLPEVGRDLRFCVSPVPVSRLRAVSLGIPRLRARRNFGLTCSGFGLTEVVSV